MTEVQDAIAIFADILSSSERPLSARRLLKLCASRDGFETWTVNGVEQVLRDSGDFFEVRRGVFAGPGYQTSLSVPETRAHSASKERVPEESEGPAEIIFPESMDEMVALRREVGGRDALRSHLLSKLKSQTGDTSAGRGSHNPNQSGWGTKALDESQQGTRIISVRQPVVSRSEEERFVERRSDDVPITEERRISEPDAELLSDLGRRVQETLEAAGKILSAQQIVSHLRKELPSLDEASVRMVVFVDNERCRHLGVREPFVVREGDGIGLTSWGLPKRFMELEQVIQTARSEQEELVKRALLHRLSELSDDGFRQAVALVLERNGITRLSLQEINVGGHAFLGAHQRRGAKLVEVFVNLRQDWSQVSGRDLASCREAAAKKGSMGVLLITLGTFSASAIAEGHRDAALEVQLIDGEALANLFYDAKVGLKAATWTFCYPDLAFFKGLAED